MRRPFYLLFPSNEVHPIIYCKELGGGEECLRSPMWDGCGLLNIFKSMFQDESGVHGTVLHFMSILLNSYLMSQLCSGPSPPYAQTTHLKGQVKATYRRIYPWRTPLCSLSGGGCHWTIIDWLVRPLATMFLGGALGGSSGSINLRWQ